MSRHSDNLLPLSSPPPLGTDMAPVCPIKKAGIHSSCGSLQVTKCGQTNLRRACGPSHASDIHIASHSRYVQVMISAMYLLHNREIL